MTQLLLRRSSALPALPALVVLIVVNTVTRDTRWLHEWFWAAYQYHFTVVLLGPAVAGLAAWDGARLARGRDQLVVSGGVLRAVTAGWGSLFGWVLAVYLLGLAWVLVWAKAAGLPGAPGPDVLLSVLPPAALLAAETALGWAAGWTTRRLLVAPVAAVTCFVAVLVLYVVYGPANPVAVGGATASLVTLRLRPDVQLLQAVTFGAVAALALLGAGRPRKVPSTSAPVGVVSLALPAVVAATVLTGMSGDSFFERVQPRLVCVGTVPEICGGPGYTEQLTAARETLRPYLAALNRAGIPAPPRFEQGAYLGNPRAAEVGNIMAVGDGRPWSGTC